MSFTIESANNCDWTREQYDSYVATCRQADGCRLKNDLQRVLKEECGEAAAQPQRPERPGTPTQAESPRAAPAPAPIKSPRPGPDCANIRRFVEKDLQSSIDETARRYNAFRESRDFLAQLRQQIAEQQKPENVVLAIGLVSHMVRAHANLIGNLLCVTPPTGAIACKLNKASQAAQKRIIDGNTAVADKVKDITQNAIEKSIPSWGPTLRSLWVYSEDITRTVKFQSDFDAASRTMKDSIANLDRQLAKAETDLNTEIAYASTAEMIKSKLIEACPVQFPVPIANKP